MTSIEWTNATWNPWAGCALVSPGCTNCYAMRRVAPRLAANPLTPHYAGTVRPTKAGHVWTGEVNRAGQARFSEPMRWRSPRMVFVNSTSDFWYAPASWRADALKIMWRCSQHVFQILTKRPEEITEREFPPNVWVGVSVEDRPRLSRIDLLRRVPASVRFLSCEPLLQDLGALDLAGIHWVIVGGESDARKRRVRAINPDWARAILRQCRAQGIAFFMKQMSGLAGALPPIPADLMVREWPWSSPPLTSGPARRRRALGLPR